MRVPYRDCIVSVQKSISCVACLSFIIRHHTTCIFLDDSSFHFLDFACTWFYWTRVATCRSLNVAGVNCKLFKDTVCENTNSWLFQFATCRSLHVEDINCKLFKDTVCESKNSGLSVSGKLWYPATLWSWRCRKSFYCVWLHVGSIFSHISCVSVPFIKVPWRNKVYRFCYVLRMSRSLLRMCL